MRIHLPLHPEHFVVADAGPSAPPLARIGGELVVVELQGELGWDGDKAGGVIGVLGLDRPVSSGECVYRQSDFSAPRPG